MEELITMGMSHLKLNGNTVKELSSGSEFELKKEDDYYEITEDSRLNKEEFDRIYKSNLDSEEMDPIDLTSTSFEEMAKNMKDISHDGGILKRLMKRGYGSLVTENSIINVHYNAYFEYSDEPFDSSHLRNQSFRYRMGSGRAIPGWEIALLSMSRGEKSRFLIRPGYAFGENGCPPRVHQNATCLFIIELLNICDKVGIDDFYTMNEDERQNVTFDQITELVNSEKMQGSTFFTQRLFKKAFNKYKQAANLLETCHLKDAKEDKECQRLLIPLNLNMTLCCIRLSHSKRAITYCNKVLKMDKNNTKALFRLGQAYYQLKQFPEAKIFLLKAQKLLPNDSSIVKELNRVEEEQQKFKFMEAETYKKMISGIETNKKDISTPVSPDSENVKAEDDVASKGFQDSITKYLKGFSDDKCQDECQLPTNMSESEMNFVLEAVNSLGLYVVQTGSGQHSYIQITKSKKLKDDQILLS